MKKFKVILYNTGRRVTEIFEMTGFTILLLLESVYYLKHAYRKRREILRQMYIAGVKSLLVCSLVALFVGMILALQDLTNPGYALIHGALFAAHVPMVNGVELNSPQFTPTANEEWLPRLQGLFEPGEGIHRLRQKIPPGLGSEV